MRVGGKEQFLLTTSLLKDDRLPPRVAVAVPVPAASLNVLVSPPVSRFTSLDLLVTLVPLLLLSPSLLTFSFPSIGDRLDTISTPTLPPVDLLLLRRFPAIRK